MQIQEFTFNEWNDTIYRSDFVEFIHFFNHSIYSKVKIDWFGNDLKYTCFKSTIS